MGRRGQLNESLNKVGTEEKKRKLVQTGTGTGTGT